jgi:hypothetical protein
LRSYCIATSALDDVALRDLLALAQVQDHAVVLAGSPMP